MKKETFEKFLEKVRSGEDSFLLLDDGKYAMYTQMRVNKDAKIIFSDYCFYRCEANDIMKMNLKPVAIVEGEQVYLYDSYQFRANGLKWEEAYEKVSEVSSLLKDARELLYNEVIPELYKKLPPVELSEERIKEAKDDARRCILNKKRFNAERPIGDMEKLLTESDFTSILCKEQDMKELVTEKYMKTSDARAHMKAYREEVQKNIDTPVCAAWEIDLAEAIDKTNAKTVNMTFSFNGKSITTPVKVESFLREFMNQSDIDWWCFSTDTEGKRILKELGANWEHRLYAYHVDEVTYRGKSIYTAPEEAKSLRGDTLEKEDDYER